MDWLLSLGIGTIVGMLFGWLIRIGIIVAIWKLRYKKGFKDGIKSLKGD